MLTGLGLLLIHLSRYPIFAHESPDLALAALGAPQGQKLIALGHALAALCVINLCSAALGTLFERALPLPQSLARFRGPFRLGLGLALLSSGTLALAALHALSSVAIAGLLTGPPILWLVLQRARWRSMRPIRLTPSNTRWLALYALLLASAFIKVFGHDLGWDALTYHLAFPERYLHSNAIVMTPFSHLSGYIATTEMLYLLALFLDGPQLAVAIHFEFGVLILWTLWLLGGRVSRGAAVLAPLFLLADPLFQTELSWAYSDLSLAFYLTFAAIAFGEMRDTAEGPERIRTLVYTGLACGMCAATRYLGVGVCVIVCALMAWPQRERTLRSTVRDVLTVALVAGAVLTPWLLRNAAFTGNPVMPLFQSFFYAPGDEYIPEIVMRQSTQFLREVGMGRDFGALLALPWNLTMNSQPGTYRDSFGFQVTALHLVGLLALATLAIVRGRLRDFAGLVPALQITALFTLFWFYGFQEARFLLPVFPLLAFAGATAIDSLAQRTTRWGRALYLLPALATLHTAIAGLGGLPAAYGYALGQMPEALRQDRGIHAAANDARTRLGPDAKLLLWMEQRGYLFRGLDYVPYHIGSGSPTLAFVEGFADHQALHCALTQMDVTHVFVNRHRASRVQPGLFVSGYDESRFSSSRTRMNRLLTAGAKAEYDRDGYELHRLLSTDCGKTPTKH